MQCTAILERRNFYKRLNTACKGYGLPFPRRLSTPFNKYDHVCCVAFRFWLGATREHPPSRPVGMTEEQQRQNRKATQPCGRRFFSAQTSLLAPYPDVSGKGMRVARASSGPKIPRRKRGRIYEMEYLAQISHR